MNKKRLSIFLMGSHMVYIVIVHKMNNDNSNKKFRS